MKPAERKEIERLAAQANKIMARELAKAGILVRRADIHASNHRSVSVQWAPPAQWRKDHDCAPVVDFDLLTDPKSQIETIRHLGLRHGVFFKSENGKWRWQCGRLKGDWADSLPLSMLDAVGVVAARASLPNRKPPLLLAFRRLVGRVTA